MSMFLTMDLLDIATIIATALKWLIYTALLWGMIKIQKLNYNVFGLLGSSLAAVLINQIPFVGCYLSHVVLVICLWKCTGADIAPDVLFTVGIAGALMFCVNLWVIGMLMGSLRPDFAHHDGAPTAMVDENGGANGSDEMSESDDDDGDEAEEKSPKQATVPQPARVAARTPVAAQKKSAPVKANGSPSPASAPNLAAPVDSGLVVKGASLNSTRSSVLISDGYQVHTVSAGESFTASLPKGRARFRCEEIAGGYVTLKNGEGQSFQLRLP